MKMLNIGCGSCFHPDWINIDMNSSNDTIIKHDIRKGIPFDDNSFDVVYNSHVLEHLKMKDGEHFIREIKRVLVNRGIIRIVVPDLETICRNYLKYLEELSSGNSKNEFRYDYSLLELFDQMTRTYSGGRLGKLWADGNIGDADFVLERHGIEAMNVIKNAQSAINHYQLGKKKPGKRSGLNYTQIRIKIIKRLISLVLGKKYADYFIEGIFRNSGEIHQTMYDKYSIDRLLRKNGFTDIKLFTPFESGIPEFDKYELDVIKGSIRKPDSIYMEAFADKL